ncbi:hypothetical protein C4A75_20720 [Brevibacillus laterosporus]|nr:hypothetical protein [Brevibacillus laterosporus]MBG9798153.1 hypothetical protein [Brevibacillus laterosporus]PPA81870.1 hypothetical protein C4A75_20720 [Brevibacillus laterosporus]
MSKRIIKLFDNEIGKQCAIMIQEDLNFARPAMSCKRWLKRDIIGEIKIDIDRLFRRYEE